MEINRIENKHTRKARDIVIFVGLLSLVTKVVFTSGDRYDVVSFNCGRMGEVLPDIEDQSYSWEVAGLPLLRHKRLLDKVHQLIGYLLFYAEYLLILE